LVVAEMDHRLVEQEDLLDQIPCLVPLLLLAVAVADRMAIRVELLALMVETVVLAAVALKASLRGLVELVVLETLHQHLHLKEIMAALDK
jgi:hypothetical protein